MSKKFETVPLGEESSGFKDPWIEMNFKRWIQFQLIEKDKFIAHLKSIIDDQRMRIDFLEECLTNISFSTVLTEKRLFIIFDAITVLRIGSNL